MDIKSGIQTLVDGISLSEAEAAELMQEIMDGKATPAQIAAFLTALRIKGESVDELVGMAYVMRKMATVIPHHQAQLCDTCGTGGDHSGTFNISTTAAFVVAGAGVKVAKHGNKALTSRAGSADLLEALGVKVGISPEAVGRCVDTVGLGFLFAPALHSAMKHAGPVRREIGIRTAFNVLGPLTNPAGAKHQVVGVFDGDYCEKLAAVLGRLGSAHALVVHGEDGLDEITLTGETRVAEWRDGRVKSFHLSPEEYGFQLCDSAALKGGDAFENAVITRSVLAGEEGPRRDVVLLNAAAALVAADRCATMREAVAAARESLDSGKADKVLQDLVQFTNAQV